jgi:hypothetical protein
VGIDVALRFSSGLLETVSVTGIFWAGPEVLKVRVPEHGLVEGVQEEGGVTVTLTVRL